MRICVLGAGAMGTYYGSLLIKGGVHATLIGRGTHLQTLRERGAYIKSPKGDFQIGPQPNARESVQGLGPTDLVLFCVKSYDTEAAAREVLPVLGEATTVLTIQNGLDNAERIARIIGEQRVLPGFTKLGVSVEKPGVLDHNAKGEIFAGEWDGRESERVLKVKKVFESAGIPFTVMKDIRRGLWKKFLWNCTLNIPDAICNLTHNRFHECEVSAGMLGRLMAEVQMVALAENVNLTAEDVKEVLESVQSFGAYEGSTLMDVRRRKKLEIESFTGTVVRLARKHGLAVPVNETLYALIKAIEWDIKATARQGYE